MLRALKVQRVLGTMVKLGRATAFATVLLLLGLAFTVHSARGQIEEKALQVGQDLAKFSDLLQGTHRVRLNGETIYLASAVTEEDKHALLDRFDEHCREHSGGLAEEFARLPQADQKRLAEKAPFSWKARFGVVRRETDDAGMVVCFAQREGDGLRSAVARLRAVVETGDLGAFGNLRYAFVRRTESGKSHVLMTFTDGRFDLNRVLGRGQEAGGDDPPGAPRPPGGRRVLSVSADGAPYGVQSFQTDATAESVAAFYRETMPTLGWEKGIAEEGIYNAAIYQRNGVAMTITALELAEGQPTMVTFVEGSPVNPSAGELGTCGDCRVEFGKCLFESKDQDEPTKKKTLERCNEQAGKCYATCAR
ncbi:MAG TPA: hypothetical protein VK550_05490 [Polyangiaceae bacterium]|jgi:hypothetical protein|nr:hypothetical protein [Polyangiaceae bacterium]